MTDPEINLLKEIKGHILSRAEWWRTAQNDPHGIHLSVHVSMIEIANAINNAITLNQLTKNNPQDTEKVPQ